MGKLSPSSTRDLHISVAQTILNKESGWKALTGTTNFGTIATNNNNRQHKLAFDLFVDRICGFVDAYYVILRGRVDALVFAGGIGEKSDRLRKAVVEQCACLGFKIDDGRNETTDKEELGKVVREVSKHVGGSDEGERAQERRRHHPHCVLVCQTNEQHEMAHASASDPALWQAAGGSEDGGMPDLSMLKVKSGHHDE